jgi:xanthine phosphoribosyltransferase
MLDRPQAFHDFAISWEEIHRHARTLAKNLLDRGPFAGIIAVARGGLVPAAIVARELGIRLVDTVCIASYVEDKQGEPRILKGVAGDGAGWLVIDDLTDTGVTARIVREMLPLAHYATIYAKPAGRPLVDSFVAEIGQDVWLLFPWDIAPQFAPPLHAQAKSDDEGEAA